MHLGLWCDWSNFHADNGGIDIHLLEEVLIRICRYLMAVEGKVTAYAARCRKSRFDARPCDRSEWHRLGEPV